MQEHAPGGATARLLRTLAGVTARETCVIKRDVAAFVTREGVASAANVWRDANFPASGGAAAPLEWVQAPILNAMTRLAVEMDPAEPATLMLGWRAGA